MSKGNTSNYWTGDDKKSLGDSFNKITSFRLPAQTEPSKAVNINKKETLTNSYIRLEQIDQAYTSYPYSKFLEVLTGIYRFQSTVDVMDLFIRCLKPDVKVDCSFNKILREGRVILERSEDSIRVFDSICHNYRAIEGKALVVSKSVQFDVSASGNCLQMKNVEGLFIGMNVNDNYFQAKVKSAHFRVFEDCEAIQVIVSDNPIYSEGSKIDPELSFLRVTQLS